MARSIAVDATEAYRAVMVWKDIQGVLSYTYEGIYSKEGTAKARITFWSGYKRKAVSETWDGPVHYVSFYDGWTEKCDLTWNKVKD